MDAVYVLGSGSKWRNNEIAYSIKSLQKHAAGLRNIWVIGEKPPVDVNWIESKDQTDIPDTNIMRKIEVACYIQQISDRFLFVNDDHFLLKDFEITEFPNYTFSTISDYIATKTNGEYAERSKNTLEVLGGSGKYFDVHTPIIYEKERFIKSVVDNWSKPMIIKSLYGNLNNLTPTELNEDVKTSKLPDRHWPFFSTYPLVTALQMRFLKETYG